MADQIIQAGRMLGQVLLPGATSPTPGSPYMYLGNTPAFTISRSVETVNHYDADGAGLKQKDASIDIQNDLTASFETDSITVSSLALWMGADVSPLAQTLQTNATQNAVVKRGGFVVLGESSSNLGGVGPVTAVTMTKSAANVPAAGNWTLDAARGTIYFNPASATLVDNDPVVITYSSAARTVQRAQGIARTLYMSLRFEGASRGGSTLPKDALMPYVKVSANGDLPMKGDDWMKMSFNLEILAPAFGAVPLEIRDGSLTGFVA
jgi:hypothetical protein